MSDTYTITTHTSTGNVPDVVLEVEGREKAEETANNLAAAFLIDATGGRLGDWTDMTVFYGSTDRFITIKTVRTVAVARPIGRCQEHPAYEADYCPVCGTAQVIGR